MTVWFVGAGPGAPDLLTVRAQRLLAAAAVVLYAGSLVPAEILAGTRPDARLVDTAGLDLDAIIGELVSAHASGHDVVRLHSGDPSIFSAVAEQARRLDAAGVPWQIIPGVPAFAAAAAALRQELTLPGVGQTVVLTRTSARATPMPAARTWPASAVCAARLSCTWRCRTSIRSPRRWCRTTAQTARSP
jgi:precorrin-4/cobalt-precorrin-4 C11-methyltransferase